MPGTSKSRDFIASSTFQALTCLLQTLEALTCLLQTLEALTCLLQTPIALNWLFGQTQAMYEYRRLNKEQRREIVEERRRQKLPRHEPAHRENLDNLYLISAACFEHASFLAESARRDEFEDKLLTRLEALRDCEIFAWCVLPNHYHVLTRVPLPQFSVMSRKLHAGTATQWNREDGTSGRQVWYRYVERSIRSDRHFFASINYLHANPVKHGYVRHAQEWKWSSVHLYLEMMGVDALREMWRNYPVREYGKGWDWQAR